MTKEAGKKSPKDKHKPNSSKSVDSSKMAQLLAKYSGFRLPPRGGQVTGTVVKVTSDKILVDFGGKSEGQISGREFADLRKLGTLPSVEETITAVVINPEDESGATILSVRTTAADTVWRNLEKIAADAGEVEAKVKSLAKSGVLVEIQGLRGFIPATFANIQILKDFEKFQGAKIKVRPIEVNKETARLICTSLPKIPARGKQEIAKKYTENLKYQGKVAALLPFGLVVSFDSLDAFVPNSEVAWEKVEDPASIFKAGQDVDFVFSGFDQSSGLPHISVKAATVDPFEKFSQHVAKDSQVLGTVSKITDFGAFVLLDAGIEGLVHVSKIPPDYKLEVGQSVNCTVDSVDIAQRRISLSLVLKTKPVGYR